MPGMINGNNVSTQPIFENIINCGIMTAGYGIISAANKSKNKTSLKGIRNFANEKAARLEVNVPMMVTERETITVFLIPENNVSSSDKRL